MLSSGTNANGDVIYDMSTHSESQRALTFQARMQAQIEKHKAQLAIGALVLVLLIFGWIHLRSGNKSVGARAVQAIADINEAPCETKICFAGAAAVAAGAYYAYDQYAPAEELKEPEVTESLYDRAMTAIEEDPLSWQVLVPASGAILGLSYLVESYFDENSSLAFVGAPYRWVKSLFDGAKNTVKKGADSVKCADYPRYYLIQVTTTLPKGIAFGDVASLVRDNVEKHSLKDRKLGTGGDIIWCNQTEYAPKIDEMTAQMVLQAVANPSFKKPNRKKTGDDSDDSSPESGEDKPTSMEEYHHLCIIGQFKNLKRMNTYITGLTIDTVKTRLEIDESFKELDTRDKKEKKKNPSSFTVKTRPIMMEKPPSR